MPYVQTYISMTYHFMYRIHKFIYGIISYYIVLYEIHLASNRSANNICFVFEIHRHINKKCIIVEKLYSITVTCK